MKQKQKRNYIMKGDLPLKKTLWDIYNIYIYNINACKNDLLFTLINYRNKNNLKEKENTHT